MSRRRSTGYRRFASRLGSVSGGLAHSSNRSSSCLSGSIGCTTGTSTTGSVAASAEDLIKRFVKVSRHGEEIEKVFWSLA